MSWFLASMSLVLITFSSIGTLDRLSLLHSLSMFGLPSQERCCWLSDLSLCTTLTLRRQTRHPCSPLQTVPQSRSMATENPVHQPSTDCAASNDRRNHRREP
ncbi:hypothetical protein BC567DRAFT_214431 [Phyllosticta citribraziliensis]